MYTHYLFFLFMFGSSSPLVLSSIRRRVSLACLLAPALHLGGTLTWPLLTLCAFPEIHQVPVLCWGYSMVDNAWHQLYWLKKFNMVFTTSCLLLLSPATSWLERGKWLELMVEEKPGSVRSSCHLQTCFPLL